MREWERECSLELISAKGKIGFQENCGVRIRGAGEVGKALSSYQKALKLAPRNPDLIKNFNFVQKHLYQMKSYVKNFRLVEILLHCRFHL